MRRRLWCTDGPPRCCRQRWRSRSVSGNVAVRVDQYDAAIGAALDTARSLGLYVIVRVQDQREQRLTVAGGSIERQRTTRLAGVGLHVFTTDGSAGFASTDDVR